MRRRFGRFKRRGRVGRRRPLRRRRLRVRRVGVRRPRTHKVLRHYTHDTPTVRNLNFQSFNSASMVGYTGNNPIQLWQQLTSGTGFFGGRAFAPSFSLQDLAANNVTYSSMASRFGYVRIRGVAWTLKPNTDPANVSVQNILNANPTLATGQMVSNAMARCVWVNPRILTNFVTTSTGDYYDEAVQMDGARQVNIAKTIRFFTRRLLFPWPTSMAVNDSNTNQGSVGLYGFPYTANAALPSQIYIGQLAVQAPVAALAIQAHWATWDYYVELSSPLS
jgi:hypothetical protein